VGLFVSGDVTGSEEKTAQRFDLTVNDPAASPVVLRGH
jgi:hypothetical protein